MVTAICWGRDGVHLSPWLKESSYLGTHPSAWLRWYVVPLAPSRGRRVEFPFDRERLRLHMNPWFPENRERDAASRVHASAFLSLLRQKEDDVSHRCSFYTRSRSSAYVMGFRLPMSSALGVCNHAPDTGHAVGVPLALSRGRSVSFPILREPWLHA